MLTVRRPAVLLPSARSKPPLGESYSQWLRSACFSSQPGGWRKVVEPEAWRKWAGDVQRWALGWLRDRGGGSRGVARQKLVSILASQCSYVTGQRLRRAQQIGQLYSNLYSERSRRGLITSLWRRFHSRNRGTGGKLVAAFAAAFMWDNERIQDEELQR
ncbi:stAR-related lipid transfer protein 7, mitochondrial-like [Chiloscyllium plagiosum]|uniref:stAR-related lipid transfer protein 7, mitochondrial-like n=1 Tax=Chiloscyllium plagiosum TaxID=36176 RepID=UPI001CB7BB27|nr:stAR-related lipid transfer protein 7, mitochondrial-like [Chiloscyllium plagiosum]